MMECCGFCENPILSDKGQILEKGLKNIIAISTELCDGLAAKFQNIPLPISIHAACRRQYTKHNGQKLKLKEKINTKDCKISKVVCRSQTKFFDFKKDCRIFL